jgi:two-component system, response regulator
MKGKPILLVEDNPHDQELTSLALRETGAGNDVVIAGDGVEALDFLFRRGRHAGRDADADPFLVLLDLNLPLIDGHGVLAAMRADPRTRLLPAVVLTTSKEDQDVLSSYRLGANGYVCKPVDFLEFREAVARLSGYWLRANVFPPAPPA